MKKLLMVLFAVFFAAGVTMAQRTVSGNVVDEEGLALIGANVLVKGTSSGTITDIDGNFSLSVPDGEDMLTISYTGYGSQDVDVSGTSNVSIVLSEGELLDDFVITAFGIEREKKALGYAVTELEEDVFALQGESDVSRILSGKVAGVQVNPSGGFLGGSTNVIVRSKGSITGTNQPLYIVDGSPYSGNISDIDPNAIVNTSVLKGLAASVLYGQEGRNGVILITTKNGSLSGDDKLEVSLSHTITRNEIANLPDYQNTYGNGADNGTVIGFVGNWGAKFDANVQVPHYYSIGRDPSYAIAFPDLQGTTVPYVAAENNVSDFFQAGIGHTTSLGINSKKGDTALAFNLGYDDQEGYVAENTYEKINVGAGIQTKLSDKFTFRSSIQFTNTDSKRPDLGFFDRLLFIPRNFDPHNNPYTNPLDNSSAYYRTDLENPLWQLENQSNRAIRNRVYTTVNLGYQLTNDLNLSYQIGHDSYTEEGIDHSNRGGIRGDNLVGWLETSYIKDRSIDQNIKLALGKQTLSEKISLTALVGANLRSSKFEFDGLYSSDQLVFGVLDHDNFKDHRPSSHPFDQFTVSSTGDFIERSNVFGVYAQADFAYDNFWYVTLSGRNDWGSSLEDDNKSLFYPSVSTALVLSDLVDMGDKVDFLKVRAGFATSAGFPQPYQTRPTLSAAASAFVLPDGSVISTNAISSFQPNPDLKPELSEELEFGVDLKMFGSRVGLDATYFSRVNNDQILAVTRPVSTGFSNSTINAGRIDTKGFELGLNLVPYQNKNFTWDIYSTFTTFENTVKDLPENNLNIFAGLNYAIEGESLGTFRGTYAMRDDEGRLLIDPTDGTIISSEDLGLEDEIIGDPNEDWRASMINTFTYKNFSLGAQLEYVSGGDIYSVTAQSLLRRGVTTDTEDREGTYILPGVLADPNTGDVIMDENGNPIANTIQLGANDLYFLNTQDTDDAAVYDATSIRLRQVTLSYQLPNSVSSKVGLRDIVVSIAGNNLWYETPNLPSGLNIDPEVLGSTLTDRAQGIDFQNDPSYKKWTASVRVKF